MSINQNVLIEKKLKKIASVKTTSLMSSCVSVFKALGQCGGTRLGYTESKIKSSTPYLAPNKVFRLTFILKHFRQLAKFLQ